MSELRSAIDSLRAETLADLPDARIEEDFAELHRACEALEGERLRRLAELDRRRTFERDGHLSAASWLASAFSMAWGTAPEAVRVARALEDMPKTRRALEGGRSPPPPCGCWPRPRRPTPMRSAGASESWWTRPGSTPSGSCSGWRGTGARRWSSSTGGRHEDTLFEWRRLHASPTIFGMVRVDGDLDPETGETLLSALRAIMDAEARSPDPTDHRTPSR